MATNFEKLQKQISRIDLSELHQLSQVIQRRIQELEEEKQDTSEKQNREVVETRRRGTITYKHEKIKCGKDACRKCIAGPSHGPYWYAYYSENGKTKSKYIGKDFKSNESEAVQAISDPVPIQSVVLVACAATKTVNKAKAKDLYISQWFKKAREYAKHRGDQWFILSAKWGLLDPERVIFPYNQTLKDYDKFGRQNWAMEVAMKIRSKVPRGSRVIILAGEAYRQDLEWILTDMKYRVEVPMRGLGIGKQLRFLTDAIVKNCTPYL